MSAPIHWAQVTPRQAVGLFPGGASPVDVVLPLNEEQEPCPWPWDPQQLVGAPLGQYHCPYCMAMVMAGVPHLDWAEALNAGGGDPR